MAVPSSQADQGKRVAENSSPSSSSRKRSLWFHQLVFTQRFVLSLVRTLHSVSDSPPGSRRFQAEKRLGRRSQKYSLDSLEFICLFQSLGVINLRHDNTLVLWVAGRGEPMPQTIEEWESELGGLHWSVFLFEYVFLQEQDALRSLRWPWG